VVSPGRQDRAARAKISARLFQVPFQAGHTIALMRPAIPMGGAWEDPVGTEPERKLADPPATWQEHWFDHRQLLRLYHHDEHCAIYLDPGVRRAEVRWLPRFINVTWQYSKAAYGEGFGPDPRIYSIHHTGRHGGGHAGYYVSPVHDYRNVSDCGHLAGRQHSCSRAARS
jgi:hypothetical protein